MDRPSILFVTPYMTTGGTEKVVFDIASALLKRHFSVRVASSGGARADALRELGVPVHTVPGLGGKSLFSVLSGAWKIRTIVRTTHCDVVNTHAYYSAISVCLGLIGRRKKVRHVFSLHIPEKQWYYRVMGATLNWMVDDIVTVCAETKAMLISYGVRGERVKVVLNGVDISRFHGMVGAPEAREIIRVGIVARLVQRKGHRVLLEAFRLLLSKLPNVPVALDIVGDGPIRTEIEVLASELGLAGRVVFHGDRTDVETLLRDMDIFVLPSEREGLPLTILEAMSSELPVIATHVNGVPEIIRDGIDGFLIPANDPHRLAECLEALVLDPATRKTFGQEGRKRVLELFSIDRMVDKYESQFRSIEGDQNAQQVAG